MRPRGLPTALAFTLVLGSCTGDDDPCSGIYYTGEDFNVSYVNVVVEGPGLGSEWWEPRVSLWDYPGSAGYPQDEITLHISQAACPDHRIIIQAHVRDDGTLGTVTYGTYWLGEDCLGMPVARTLIPVSDGSATFHRTEEHIVISFNNLRILNRAPPEEPVDVESIILNGLYQAPATCLETP